MDYKIKVSLYDRVLETTNILKKYPNKIPVICEKCKTNIDCPDIDKNKYLVPSDLTVGQFLYIIRKRVQITAEKAIYIFIDNKMPPTAQTMSYLYEQYKDDDGFLYVLYAAESTFG